MKRLAYLDALRGVAILTMVVDHAYDWWLDEAGHATTMASVTRVLGTLSAPLFFALVGVGLALSAQRSAEAGRPRRDVALHHFKRGLILVLWGYALNLLVFYVGDNPADLFAVDVLKTIGVSVWMSLPLLWVPAWGAAVVALALSVLGQTAGGWVLPSWLAAYLTGTGGIAYFPLLLWLPYAYLGLAIGKWIAGVTRPGRVMSILASLGLLALLGSALIDPAWGYRHPRPVFIPFSLAAVFWLMAGLWLWTERLGWVGPIARALRDMGQASLMLYVLHHLVGYRLFWMFGWVRGRSWRGQYGVFGPLEATALFVGLVGLMWAAARVWLRWRKGERTASAR